MTSITGNLVEAYMEGERKPLFFQGVPRVNDTVIVGDRKYIVTEVIWRTDPEMHGSQVVHYPNIQIERVFPKKFDPEETWRRQIGISIDELLQHGLSMRARNALLRGGYEFIQDVAGPDEEDLCMNNFGPKSKAELERAIASYKKSPQ